MINLNTNIFGRKSSQYLSLVNNYKNNVLLSGGTIEALGCLNNFAKSLKNKNLLDNASIILFPSGYNTSTLYSFKGDNFSFSRGSLKTRFNSSLSNEIIGNNIPSLNYTSTNICPTLLLEPPRTNFVLFSNTFNSGFTFSNFSYSATTNNLSLTEPAWQITSTNNSSNALRRFITTPLPSGSTLTASLFIKKLNLTTFQLNLSNGIDSELSTSWVFTASTPQNISSNIGNWTDLSTRVDNINNEWFRVYLTVKLGNTSLNYNPSSLTVTNVKSGESLLIQNSQLEIGGLPTSYIPTSASTVTRAADNTILSGATSLIGQTEGVIYWEGSCEGLTDLLGINQSLVNGIYLNKGGGSLYRITIYANSTPISFADNSIKTSKVKIALAYKSGDSAMFVNGAKIGVTNTTAFSFSGSLNSIRLNDNYLIGTQPQEVNAICIYGSRLTDSECISLTTL